MLGFLLLCLSIGFCYCKFDVSVTVLDPFYLNYYYDDDVCGTYRQLQLEFDVSYGDKRSNAHYFQTDFETCHYDHRDHTPSHFKFVKYDNIILPFFNPLVLDSPIPLPEVSPDDNLDIRFDINPVYIYDDDISAKCSSHDRLHNHTIVPKSVLHSQTRDNVTSKLTFDLSHTRCLNSTEYWFHDIKAQITVKVDFDCHGPCQDLFPTTTTTTPVTTPVTTPLTTNATALVSSSTRTSTGTPTTQSQTENPTGDSNKLVVPLALVAVIAVLELIMLIGGVVYFVKRVRPDYFKRKKVEPSTMYYDTETQKTSNEGPSAPRESMEIYAEMHDTNEEYSRSNEPVRNQENHGQNEFAGNALYGQ